MSCCICGGELIDRKGTFVFSPPLNTPGIEDSSDIVIPNVEWMECNSCKEVFLSAKISNIIEEERCRRFTKS